MSPPRFLLAMILLSLVPSFARATDNTPQPWMDRLAALPIQDGGRVMPLDTYARNLAVQLTGRSAWAVGKGPEGYSGKKPIELLCDLTFRGSEIIHKPLIIIETAQFKTHAGLDPKQRFFTPVEIGGCKPIEEMLSAASKAKQADAKSQPSFVAMGWQFLATVLLYPFAHRLIEMYEDSDVRFR